ncbi:MAG: hypothetical protein WCK00_12395 [Deltaproteobacteria bacterium]
MTPKTGRTLLEKIVPIIQGTIPKAVKTTRCEDFSEVIQDCIHEAAKMLDSAEKAGKKVPAKSIAYYAIQRCKSGRRSWTSSATDAMSPMFVAGSSDRVISLDGPISEAETSEGLTMHDFISERREDPSAEALRKIDWEEFNATLNRREQLLVRNLAEGRQSNTFAKELGLSPPRITQMKKELGNRIRRFMGDSILEDITAESPWEKDIRCIREKAAWHYAAVNDFEPEAA